MSWSVQFVGTPEKVAEALETANQGMSGQSKIEWDEAKPLLVGLVNQNFTSDLYRERYKPYSGATIIRLTANGSGTEINGEQAQRVCSVNLEVLYGAMV